MNERPLCPYEQDMFDKVVEDEQAAGPADDPSYIHVAHQTALLVVMTWRAASASSTQSYAYGKMTPMPVAAVMERQPEDAAARPGAPKVLQKRGYIMEGKLAPHFEAYVRLNRELERWRRYTLRHRAAWATERQGVSAACAKDGTSQPDTLSEEREQRSASHASFERGSPREKERGSTKQTSSPASGETSANRSFRSRLGAEPARNEVRDSPNRPPCILDDPAIAAIRKAEAAREAWRPFRREGPG